MSMTDIETLMFERTLEDYGRPKEMSPGIWKNLLNSRAKKRVTAIDLFAGCGGFSCGMIQGGINVIWAIDFARDACETYRFNLGNNIVEKDITKVKSEDIPDCDIVFGSPPCQGFSTAGKRNPDDPRSKLVFEFIRVVRDKQPKLFILENVPGLCSMGGYETKEDKVKHEGRLLKIILQGFRDAGYKVKWNILNAVDYGVPQNRKRIFIIGIRPGSSGVSDDKALAAWPPKPTHFSPEVIEQKWKEEIVGEITRQMKALDEQKHLDGKSRRAELLIADLGDFEKGKISVQILKRHQKTQKNLKGKLVS